MKTPYITSASALDLNSEDQLDITKGLRSCLDLGFSEDFALNALISEVAGNLTDAIKILGRVPLGILQRAAYELDQRANASGLAKDKYAAQATWLTVEYMQKNLQAAEDTVLSLQPEGEEATTETPATSAAA